MGTLQEALEPSLGTATLFHQFLGGPFFVQHPKICWNITHVKLIAWREEHNQF